MAQKPKNVAKHENGWPCKVRRDHRQREQRGLAAVSMALRDFLEDHGIPGEEGMHDPHSLANAVEPKTGAVVDRERRWFVPVWVATLCNLGLHRDHLSKWLVRCKKDQNLFKYVEVLLTMARGDRRWRLGTAPVVGQVLRHAMYELEKEEQARAALLK